jgi:hypothetical protein
MAQLAPVQLAGQKSCDNSEILNGGVRKKGVVQDYVRK